MTSLVQTCRVCGCTDANACETPTGPCCWVEPDLCSACRAAAELPFQLTDLRALVELPEIKCAIPGVVAFQLLAALQLSLRHPDLPEHVRESVEHFATELAKRVSVTPNLMAIAAAGFDQACDVPAERERSGIILPGDPGFGL